MKMTTHRKMTPTQRDMCKITAKSPAIFSPFFVEFFNTQNPPRHMEYSRLPSPPSSTHSSQDNNSVIGHDEYVKKRNEKILEYDFFWTQARSRFKNVKLRPLGKESPESEACYGSTSKDSNGCIKPNQATRRDDSLKNLIENEEKKRKCHSQSFYHYHYSMLPFIAQSNFLITKLDRMQRILKGEPLDASAWETIINQLPEELNRLYGALNENCEEYKAVLNEFRMGKYPEIIKMIEEENKLIDLFNKHEIYPSNKVIAMKAENLALVQRNLEEALRTYLENALDNVTTMSSLGIDFFALQRPDKSIKVYRIRSKEYKDLVEFQLLLAKDNEIETTYNPALFDVGWAYFSKYVTLDVSKKKFVGIPGTIKSVNFMRRKNWSEFLLELRDLLSEYPFGVEAKTFCKVARTRCRLHDNEQLFGLLSDKKGIKKLSDLFFPQKLVKGKDERVILFHGICEGVIVSPDEILSRIWSRIYALLEKVSQVKIHDLKDVYQRLYGQPLDFSSWGLPTSEDLVQFCMENISNEKQDVEIFVTELLGIEWKCLRIKNSEPAHSIQTRDDNARKDLCEIERDKEDNESMRLGLFFENKWIL